MATTTNIQTFSGKIEVKGTTTSSSKITGALTVAGGVGIADALYGANANLEDVEADSVNITDSTPSSSKITGALKVAGGVGVSGALYGANANLEDVEADSVNITDSTASTSTNTGALTVAGGVGVTSNIHTSNLFASDYVGIGTTDPNQKLHLLGTGTDSGPKIRFETLNNGDNGEYTVDGTEIGGIQFGADDLTWATQNMSSEIVGIHRNPNYDGARGDLVFKTSGTQGSAPTERMRILYDGNVGIGTAIPDSRLVVQVGGTNNTVRTGLILRTPESADETGYNIDFYQSTALVSRIAALTESSGQIGMAFSTYNGSTAERMRIDANGNVGIGTDDPATYLHLSATNSDPGAIEGDFVGTHNLTEYLRFSSIGDTGDVNNVSVGFKLGADDNAQSAPDGRLDICANDGADEDNGYGNIPNTTIATFLGSGNVGIGTTNPGYNLDVNGSTKLGKTGCNTNPGNEALKAINSNYDAAYFESDHSLGLVSVVRAQPSTGASYNSASPYLQNAVYRADLDATSSTYWKYFSGNRDGTNEFYVQSGGGAYFAGNVGIGTNNPTRSLQIKRGISYISGGTSNNSAFEIVQQLGTDDYTFKGQHRAQFRIKSGLGTYSNRSLELALLDNGRGIMQASAASEGYFPISINPKGDYNSTVSIGSYSSGAKLHVQGNVYATSDIITAGNVGIGSYSPGTKLDVAGVGRFTINGGSVQLVGTDHTYLEYYPDGTSAGRKAYVGYASGDDNNFTISNSAGSGHIILSGKCIATNGFLTIEFTQSLAKDTWTNIIDFRSTLFAYGQTFISGTDYGIGTGGHGRFLVYTDTGSYTCSYTEFENNGVAFRVSGNHIQAYWTSYLSGTRTIYFRYTVLNNRR